MGACPIRVDGGRDDRQLLGAGRARELERVAVLVDGRGAAGEGQSAESRTAAEGDQVVRAGGDRHARQLVQPDDRPARIDRQDAAGGNRVDAVVAQVEVQQSRVARTAAHGHAAADGQRAGVGFRRIEGHRALAGGAAAAADGQVAAADGIVAVDLQDAVAGRAVADGDRRVVQRAAGAEGQRSLTDAGGAVIGVGAGQRQSSRCRSWPARPGRSSAPE